MRRSYAVPISLALLLTLPMLNPTSAIADPQVPTLPGPSLQGPTLPGQSVQGPTLAARVFCDPTATDSSCSVRLGQDCVWNQRPPRYFVRKWNCRSSMVTIPA